MTALQGPVCPLNWRTVFILYLICVSFSSLNMFVCLFVFEVIFPEPIIVNLPEDQELEGVFIKILC